MNIEDLIYMYIDNGKIDLEKIADEFSGYLWTTIVNSGISQIDDIKDIISDVYLILWNNQERLNINKPLSPYLIGIVKNLIKRYFSKFSKKFAEGNIDDYENLILEDSKIEEGLEVKEINSNILKFISNFKKEEKDIFIEFYYEEKKIKEIAEKYNFSEAKVKTKLHRLRNKLRKELLKGGYSING